MATEILADDPFHSVRVSADKGGLVIDYSTRSATFTELNLRDAVVLAKRQHRNEQACISKNGH